MAIKRIIFSDGTSGVFEINLDNNTFNNKLNCFCNVIKINRNAKWHTIIIKYIKDTWFECTSEEILSLLED